MGSLSVFKIKNYQKNDLTQEKIITSYQKGLNDYDEFEELATPISILKKLNYDENNGIVNYNVIHYSDTINHPVRIYWENISEEDILPASQKITKGTRTIEKGYQEIYTFDVIINFKTDEMFIFTKKEIAYSLIKRLKNSKKLDFEVIEFDLTKIEEVKGFDNIWGLWEDGVGKCKKKAYFGTEVQKEEEVKRENVTSYNAEFTYLNNSIDLVVCKEGRISSRSSSVANADLIRIYNNLKESLGKDKADA